MMFYSHGKEKNKKIRNLDYCSSESHASVQRDFVTNMGFLWSKGWPLLRPPSERTGENQMFHGKPAGKQIWLCSCYVYCPTDALMHKSGKSQLWGASHTTPFGPWARGNFQQQRHQGRASLETAAILNEVRTLAKVGKKHQAKAGLGSMPVGL